MTTRARALAAAGLVVGALAGCGGGADADDGTTPKGDASASASATSDALTSVDQIEPDTKTYTDAADFAKAASATCEQMWTVNAAMPVYAAELPGKVKEYTGRAAADKTFAALLGRMKPPAESSKDWATFVAAAQTVADNEAIVATTAASKNADSTSNVESTLFDSYTAQDTAGKPFGSCDYSGTQIQPDVWFAETAEATKAAAAAPRPTGTVKAAAEEFLAALQSGDCPTIKKLIHSQDYADPSPEECANDAEGWKGYRVAATAEFGPAGAAVLVNDDGYNAYFELVMDPAAGNALRWTATVNAARGGSQPANTENDAQETADAFVKAIRDNDFTTLTALQKVDVPFDVPKDEDSFVKTKPFDSLGNDKVYKERVVSDLREDTDAEPVLLGIDQTQAYFLVDTDKTDWVYVLRHEPGTPTEYRFSAYWAITE